MNKNIKLAVAGAVLALSASAANAGIVIPAGDWTLDIGGNVNMFSTWTKAKGTNVIGGGIHEAGGVQANSATTNMTTGLLPNFLSVSGTTRQNDLDVGFTISLQPGSSVTTALQQVPLSSAANNINNRQAFITFGDKSWGSIKIGKDLGIFASDAILNDMTLLGVGAPSGAGSNTTLGRIGTGYLYADWKPQIAYTTPNFNGFQATAGISQAFAAVNLSTYSATGSSRNASPAYEGKASYSFAANDVTGKVWVSGIAQKSGVSSGAFTSHEDPTAYAGDIGANVNVAGFGLTGYYYKGQGIGTTGQMVDGYSTSGQARDSDGGYVQLTYVLPTKTKVGISWGESNLDKNTGDDGMLVKTNEMWTAAVYHPLTKHLNLVAEYSNVKEEAQSGVRNTSNTGSLGAILFF